jgi:hypothetical protein
LRPITFGQWKKGTYQAERKYKKKLQAYPILQSILACDVMTQEEYKENKRITKTASVLHKEATNARSFLRGEDKGKVTLANDVVKRRSERGLVM